MKFYNEIPDMECLAGDTLPEFRVRTGQGLTDTQMQLILAREKTPSTEALCVNCHQDLDGTFRVRLTSDETSRLTEGWYMLHFRLTDDHARCYRKLAGRLYVRSAAKGEV